MKGYLTTTWGRLQKPIIAAGVALVLYLIGLKFLVLPALVIGNALYLPLPAIFRSFVSRLVVAGLLTASLVQVAATLQFLLVPSSGFKTLAFLSVLLHISVWLIAPVKKADERFIWFSRSDMLALVVGVFFLLPLGAMIARSDPVERIARIGSVQAIDGTNHFAGIAEMTQAEHFNYKPGYYYPKGFHITAGFAQNTLFDKQYDLGWRGNAMLYMTHYVVLGMAMAWMLFYVALSLLRHIAQKQNRTLQRRTELWLALTLGPTAALFYIVPFVTEGFLNYYYAITTIGVGIIVLLGLYERQAGDLPSIKEDSITRWGVFSYLLLLFGASVSWPLLIPPLALIGIICVLPGNLSLKAIFSRTVHWRTLAVIVAFALQLLPIYFQLQYAGVDGSQGINATGGLKEFHPYVLLAGFLIVLGIVFGKAATAAFKRALITIFVPLAAFVGLLIMVQYYSVGEIRYYVIKTSLLLEVLLLALGVALLVYAYFERSKLELKYTSILLPVVPFVIMVVLIGSSANPLKALRDLFRDYSGQGYPAYFQQDISNYTRLGSEGNIKHFNSTVLHYNHEKQLFYAHMQMAFWSNMMQYDSSDRDFHALHCVGGLYSNIAFGGFTPAEQDVLVQKIKSCATRARAYGQEFYIITDKESVLIIKQTFGELVKVIHR